MLWQKLVITKTKREGTVITFKIFQKHFSLHYVCLELLLFYSSTLPESFQLLSKTASKLPVGFCYMVLANLPLLDHFQGGLEWFLSSLIFSKCFLKRVKDRKTAICSLNDTWQFFLHFSKSSTSFHSKHYWKHLNPHEFNQK